jgi:hypothetical protein
MRRLQTKDPTLIQVLSLYLLLLAFFVLLFNASQYDRGRASAVKESLSSTFRTHGNPADDVVARSSDQGQRPGAELVLDSFADLIRTELKVAKIENLKRGRLLRVTLGADDLFVSGNATLRDDRNELLSKLAQLLGKSPPGLRHKVEAFLVGGWIPPDRMTQAVPLPIARAATLAEALIARGALRGTVSGGVRYGTGSQLALIYRVDPEIRPFDAAPPSASKNPGTKP